MTKREKAIKGLGMCEGQPDMCGLRDCPYFKNPEDYWNKPVCEEELMSDALELLKEQDTPVEAELEGGGSWWYVCGECHGIIHSRDSYCRHCGRKLKWDVFGG